MEPWDHLDAFEASSMALSMEVDAVLVSMLPFEPWSRLSTDQGIFVGIPQFRHL